MGKPKFIRKQRANVQLSLSSALSDAGALAAALRDATHVLIKRLSRNDRGWAFPMPTTNQAGPYLPSQWQESGFVPVLAPVAEKPHIHRAIVATVWPQLGGEIRLSRVSRYTKKGRETHLTHLPKELFVDLAPASFLVAVPRGAGVDFRWDCITVDAGSDEAQMLIERFSLGVDFDAGVFDIADLAAREQGETDALVTYLVEAWHAGRLDNVIAALNGMPTADELATQAQQQYLQQTGLKTLDPFELDAPGDVLRYLTAELEYSLFKTHQRRIRAAALVPIVIGNGNFTADGIIGALVRRFGDIDAVLLSASQQRRSRAGTSFELHLGRFLRDGNVPHARQRVVGSRRPDFILPGITYYKAKRADIALVLSAKTTIRERWKQVLSETHGCKLFLATRDAEIPASSIAEMHDHGICLVVPESLIADKTAEYEGQPNVISFHTFFHEELRRRRTPIWKAQGIAR